VDEVAAVAGGHERAVQHRKAHMDWAVRGANGRARRLSTHGRGREIGGRR
jgi:hypothetical protein